MKKITDCDDVVDLENIKSTLRARVSGKRFDEAREEFISIEACKARIVFLMGGYRRPR